MQNSGDRSIGNIGWLYMHDAARCRLTGMTDEIQRPSPTRGAGTLGQIVGRGPMRSAFDALHARLGREITADAYGWFAEAIAQGDIYIALDGSEIVGAIATRRRDADMAVALISVIPTRQKGGNASFMIGRVAEIARSRGLRTLSLTTAEMMEDRIRLYRRHGFEIVRRGLPEHGKDAHMRVHMERVLAADAARLIAPCRSAAGPRLDRGPKSMRRSLEGTHD